MDKMKMQDVQLMQSSGVAMSTDNDQSTVMGTTPATNGSSSQGTASQGANRPSWPADPQEWNHLYPQVCAKKQRTRMIRSSSINVHQLISFGINPMCAMCTELTLCYPLQQMQA